MFEVKSMAGIPSLMSKSVTSFLAALPSFPSFSRLILLIMIRPHLLLPGEKNMVDHGSIEWQIMAAYLDMVAISYHRLL